jgi:hypothetical protein
MVSQDLRPAIVSPIAESVIPDISWQSICRRLPANSAAISYRTILNSQE